jgi:thiamine pyrophosphokinase
MRVVIFSNGDVGPADFYLTTIKSDDYLICADGGANAALALELIPDMVVGDMDSIEPSVRLELCARGSTEFRTVSPRKDESDTELALRAALEREPEEILLTAVLGRRMDHAIANVHLLALVPDGVPCSIEEPDLSIRLVRSSLTLRDWRGALVSILAVGGDAWGVTLTGFEYPLEGADLRQASSLGISNVVTDAVATISVASGMVLVIRSSNRG